MRNFNPLSRVGEQHRHFHSRLIFWHYFNPRSPVVSNAYKPVQIRATHIFQPTLPRKERRARAWWHRCRVSNPRSRVGNDHSYFGGMLHLSQFQSTLPRWKRHIYNPLSGDSPRFQPTLSPMELHLSDMGTFYQKLFQPALPRKERLLKARHCVDIGLFQSTLPRRERPLFPVMTFSTNKFQPSLPRLERHHRFHSRLIFWHYFNPHPRIWND